MHLIGIEAVLASCSLVLVQSQPFESWSSAKYRFSLPDWWDANLVSVWLLEEPRTLQISRSEVSMGTLACCHPGVVALCWASVSPFVKQNTWIIELSKVSCMCRLCTLSGFLHVIAQSWTPDWTCANHHQSFSRESDRCAYSAPVFPISQHTLCDLWGISGPAFQRPFYDQIFIQVDFSALPLYTFSSQTVGGQLLFSSSLLISSSLFFSRMCNSGLWFLGYSISWNDPSPEVIWVSLASFRSSPHTKWYACSPRQASHFTWALVCVRVQVCLMGQQDLDYISGTLCSHLLQYLRHHQIATSAITTDNSDPAVGDSLIPSPKVWVGLDGNRFC